FKSAVVRLVVLCFFFLAVGRYVAFVYAPVEIIVSSRGNRSICCRCFHRGSCCLGGLLFSVLFVNNVVFFQNLVLLFGFNFPGFWPGTLNGRAKIQKNHWKSSKNGNFNRKIRGLFRSAQEPVNSLKF